jgi:ribonuclease P protein subunit POP4
MKKRLLDPYRNVNIRELIGLDIEVVSHPDPTVVGAKGAVIDETRSTFLIKEGVKDRRITKKGAMFDLTVEGDKGPMKVRTYGDDLLVRPVDRTKKLERRKLRDDDIRVP